MPENDTETTYYPVDAEDQNQTYNEMLEQARARIAEEVADWWDCQGR